MYIISNPRWGHEVASKIWIAPSSISHIDNPKRRRWRETMCIIFIKRWEYPAGAGPSIVVHSVSCADSVASITPHGCTENSKTSVLPVVWTGEKPPNENTCDCRFKISSHQINPQYCQRVQCGIPSKTKRCASRAFSTHPWMLFELPTPQSHHVAQAKLHQENKW